MQWVILGIFLLITIVLLSGRGSWLIAGYNTMSKKRKSQFDEKMLCRRVGIMMLIIDIVLLITFIIMETRYGIENESLVGLSAFALIIIVIVIGMVISNKKVEN